MLFRSLHPLPWVIWWPGKVPAGKRVEAPCHILDVTPTILAMMEIPLGDDMDGAPVVNAIEPDWLLKHQIEYVQTHDTANWLAGRPKSDIESPDKAKRIDQLKALGYIK